MKGAKGSERRYGSHAHIHLTMVRSGVFAALIAASALLAATPMAKAENQVSIYNNAGYAAKYKLVYKSGSTGKTSAYTGGATKTWTLKNIPVNVGDTYSVYAYPQGAMDKELKCVKDRVRNSDSTTLTFKVTGTILNDAECKQG